MAESNKFQAVTMSVFNMATLGAAYASMNGTGFTEPLKQIKFYNGSTVGVTVSYNGGALDQDYFPAGCTQIIDVQTNNTPQASSPGTWNVGKGQIVMGKGGPGVGNLYIVGYF